MLSTTTAPAAARRGASWREAVAPVEHRAMSMPGEIGRRPRPPPRPHRRPRAGGVPAERAEAKKRTSSTGKRALGQHSPHDQSDLAGRPEHPDAHGAILPRCRPGTSRRRPAGAAGSAELEGGVQRAHGLAPPDSVRTMHEIRMVEVEIMSMLIPSAASVSNMVAVTPGCVFIPAPTSDTRATSSSETTPVAPELLGTAPGGHLPRSPGRPWAP